MKGEGRSPKADFQHIGAAVGFMAEGKWWWRRNGSSLQTGRRNEFLVLLGSAKRRRKMMGTTVLTMSQEWPLSALVIPMLFCRPCLEKSLGSTFLLSLWAENWRESMGEKMIHPKQVKWLPPSPAMCERSKSFLAFMLRGSCCYFLLLCEVQAILSAFPQKTSSSPSSSHLARMLLSSTFLHPSATILLYVLHQKLCIVIC